jgi:hypothetical protein
MARPKKVVAEIKNHLIPPTEPEPNPVIYIVFDDDYFPTKIVGVYGNYKDARKQLKALAAEGDPDSSQHIVAWDIITNQEHPI